MPNKQMDIILESKGLSGTISVGGQNLTLLYYWRSLQNQIGFWLFGIFFKDLKLVSNGKCGANKFTIAWGKKHGLKIIRSSQAEINIQCIGRR